jgi:hypothetical protein
MEGAGNPHRPFCSERCKLIDLGNWVTGAYRVSQQTADEDEEGESPCRKDSDEE